MLSLILSSRSLVSRSSQFIARPSIQFSAPLVANASSWFSTAATTPNADASQQSPSPSEETIHVPKNMVRFLIGIKGKNLAALTERSGGGKILFTKQETPQGEEIAKLLGDASQIAQMRQLIKEDMDKLKTDPAASTVVQKPAADTDYMEEVIVDSQYVGLLIGKLGATLKEMEGSTGAKIQYSTRDDSAQERTARIRGTVHQVTAAKKLISDKIYSIADDMRSGKRFEERRTASRPAAAPRTRASSPTDVKQVVEVPSECVGHLIGKGGKHLFQMQDQTGAKFNFAKEDHREGAREVTIFGTEEQVRNACDAIQQKVRLALERTENGAQ